MVLVSDEVKDEIEAVRSIYHELDMIEYCDEELYRLEINFEPGVSLSVVIGQVNLE